MHLSDSAEKYPGNRQSGNRSEPPHVGSTVKRGATRRQRKRHYPLYDPLLRSCPALRHFAPGPRPRQAIKPFAFISFSNRRRWSRLLPGQSRSNSVTIKSPVRFSMVWRSGSDLAPRGALILETAIASADFADFADSENFEEEGKVTFRVNRNSLLKHHQNRLSASLCAICG